MEAAEPVASRNAAWCRAAAERINAAFACEHICVADRSDGHVAAAVAVSDTRAMLSAGVDPDSALKLLVLVVSGAFAGTKTIARHQKVQAVFEKEFASGRVHAMQLRCWTVEQWEAKGQPRSYAVDQPCTYALQGGRASPDAAAADADDKSGDGVLLSPKHPLSPRKKGGGSRRPWKAEEESPAAEAPAALLRQMSIDPA